MLLYVCHITYYGKTYTYTIIGNYLQILPLDSQKGGQGPKTLHLDGKLQIQHEPNMCLEKRNNMTEDIEEYI